MNANFFVQSVCGHETIVLRGESKAADNNGYTAMQGSVLGMTDLCKVEHLFFVL